MTTPTTYVPSITTYIVVPLLTENGIGVQNCNYYTNDFQPVPPGPLVCDDPNRDLVRIKQVEYTLLPAHIQKLEVDQRAALYAAVAATVDEDLGLPTLFRASAARSVVIPVADQTLRGVILVFAEKDSKGRVIRLRPTTDPQIANGG